jgi:hypothetical protein
MHVLKIILPQLKKHGLNKVVLAVNTLWVLLWFTAAMDQDGACKSHINRMKL